MSRIFVWKTRTLPIAHLTTTPNAYAYIFAYMADTSIRVSEEAKRRLELLKREGESFEDVIMRLTEEDKWAGFGALAETETDTREGMRAMRDRMREGVAEDLDIDDDRGGS